MLWFGSGDSPYPTTLSLQMSGPHLPFHVFVVTCVSDPSHWNWGVVTVHLRWVEWNCTKVKWTSVPLIIWWVTPRLLRSEHWLCYHEALRWQIWVASQWSSVPVHEISPPTISSAMKLFSALNDMGSPKILLFQTCTFLYLYFSLSNVSEIFLTPLFSLLCFHLPKGMSNSWCITWVEGDTLWNIWRNSKEGKSWHGKEIEYD